MTDALRILFCALTVVWLTGCGQMIPIDEVNGSGTITRELTKEQVKEAIIEGAMNAGWIAKDVGNDQIAATYRVRAHTVVVTIEYSQDLYDIRYKSSSEMKIQCSAKDYKKSTNIVVTGRQACPGFEDPYAIHGNYAQWVNNLRTSIDHSLTFAG